VQIAEHVMSATPPQIPSSARYFRGQPPFEDILAEITNWAARL
jgi:hypothetical protein